MVDAIEERLALAGRSPDQDFAGDEQLYLRVARLDAAGGVPVNEVGYPGSNGMSVNRGKYSLPSDVLYPCWPDLGVAAIRRDAVPERAPAGDGSVFELSVVHDPVEVPAKATCPSHENYAHSLITTRKQVVGSQPSKVPGTIKTWVRGEFARKLQVVKAPKT